MRMLSTKILLSPNVRLFLFGGTISAQRNVHKQIQTQKRVILTVESCARLWPLTFADIRVTQSIHWGDAKKGSPMIGLRYGLV